MDGSHRNLCWQILIISAALDGIDGPSSNANAQFLPQHMHRCRHAKERTNAMPAMALLDT